MRLASRNRIACRAATVFALVALALAGCQKVRVRDTTGAPTADVELAYQRGAAALQQGRYSDAIPDLQTVVESRPSDTIARYNLGVAFQRVRSYRESVETLTGAGVAGFPVRSIGSGIQVPSDSDGDYLYALATSFQESRQFDQALVCFDASIRSFPEHLPSRFGRALTLQQSGRTQDARRAWEDYLARDASSSWAQSAREHLAKINDKTPSR
jgi:tetratricopeptide (TPR) repeat protein